MLSRELGVAPQQLTRLARELASRELQVVVDSVQREDRAEDESGPVPLVARVQELADMEAEAAATAAGESRILVLAGEPGIGKTRLAGELGGRLEGRGWRTLAARAYESESLRSFGVWLDLVAGIEAREVPAELRALLAPSPVHDDSESQPEHTSRDRLFRAISQLLEHLQEGAPVALFLDDLQWFDEASISLLHYVIRESASGSRLLIVGGLRPGEIVDNLPLLALLRELRRSARVRRIELGPLRTEDVAELTSALADALDAKLLTEQSGGNPLMALEIVRARCRGDQGLPDSVTALIQRRLEQLEPGSQQLLPWAAALGARFGIDTLIQATGKPALSVSAGLEALEQRDVIRARADGSYEFVHDLVRQSAYEQLSEPRRRLIHRQIADAMREDASVGEEAAAELAAHAELGGDILLASRSLATAGKWSLRLFAAGDAIQVAQRGLALLDSLARPDHVAERLALLEVLVLASAERVTLDSDALEAELRLAATLAGSGELPGLAGRSHYLLSVLLENRGDSAAAERASLEAARLGRLAAGAAGARQLANSARCIIQLEGDVTRARGLLADAGRLARESALEDVELHWGRGLLAHWDGELDLALESLEAALGMASALGDRWRQCSCLYWLASIQYDRGDLEPALARANELEELGRRMTDEGKASFGRGVGALCGYDREDTSASSQLQVALDGLRRCDAKAHLAWVLNRDAARRFVARETAAATRAAREALAAAEAVRRPCEVARARSLLARMALEDGDFVAAREYIAPMRAALAERDVLSAPARILTQQAIRRIDASAGAASRPGA